jgi:4-amino-4-deoxy-L-arabinose transferase-like glycosyltransferase
MKSWFIPIVCICLLPLFFINVKDSHDWGDDFAQYLLQAENMVKGIPQTETGYVYDVRFPVVAPPAYPAGFPLMLAPVYALWGHSILHYNLLITAFLFLFCLAMAIFFRRFFSWQASLVMTLIFAYNAWTLDFKTNILSDFPFALLLLAATLLYLRDRSIPNALATGLALALLLLTRGVGLVFLVAVLIHGTYRIVAAKDRSERKKTALQVLCITAVSLGLQYFVNTVLFHIPAEGFFAFYGKAFGGSSMLDTFLHNLEYYKEVFKAFFYPEFPWTILSALSANAALLLLVIGFIYSLAKQRSLMDLLTGLYLLLFLFYPYSAGGFRFLMPVVPFLIMYMARGMMALRLPLLVPAKLLVGAAALFFFILYEPGLTRILARQKDILEGPQRDYAKETFAYLGTHLASNDVVLFKKPKALALYSQVKTCSAVHGQKPAEVASYAMNSA